MQWWRIMCSTALRSFGPTNLGNMNDEQMLAWIRTLEEQLSVAAQLSERHLVTEISKAILDSDARVLRRLDEIHDEFKRPNI